MKQIFKITHFIGRSDNAIRIQVAITMIAYLLKKMLCKMAHVNQTLLETSKLVQTNLMQRRDFTGLKQQETRPPITLGNVPRLGRNMSRTAVASRPGMTAPSGAWANWMISLYAPLGRKAARFRFCIERLQGVGRLFLQLCQDLAASLKNEVLYT